MGIDDSAGRLPHNVEYDTSDNTFEKAEYVAIIPVSEKGDEVLLFRAKDEIGQFFWSVPSGKGPLADMRGVDWAAERELENDMHITGYPIHRSRMFGYGAIFEVVIPKDIKRVPKKRDRVAPEWFQVDRLPPASEFIHNQHAILVDHFGIKS